MDPTPFQALLDRAVATGSLAPITDLLGCRLESWSPGEAVVAMAVDARHHNSMGTVHGGIFGDVADVACGCAIASVLGAGERFSTVNLHLTYLKALRQGTLRGRARVVRRGRQTAYLECDLEDRAGDLLARATSTCLIAT